MKKILIVSHAMEIGGAERALIGLLDNIDYSKYEVDLFLLRHSGELLQYINKNVNLLPEICAYSCLGIPMVQALKKRRLDIVWGRLVGNLKAEKFCKKNGITENSGVAIEYSHKYTRKILPRIQPNVKYDIAISFLTPHYFVAERTKAKKKIAWIHTDYSAVRVDIESELKMWSVFDSIISISEKVSETFISTFPSLAGKVTIIENIQPESLIRCQVEAFSVEQEMPKEDDVYRLLSIGRFSFAKNFDNVPDICKRLLEKGVKVKWYLIGFGGEEDLIRQKIAEAGMQENVIILGKKQNPYPYIKACDLYVQPSRYEGKAVTVQEAQMLGKPVVITEYATSASQLDNCIDGVIISLNNAECAEDLGYILSDSVLMRRISEGCSQRDYSNAQEIKKLYELIED